jgi:hypothetical protein
MLAGRLGYEFIFCPGLRAYIFVLSDIYIKGPHWVDGSNNKRQELWNIFEQLVVLLQQLQLAQHRQALPGLSECMCVMLNNSKVQVVLILLYV